MSVYTRILSATLPSRPEKATPESMERAASVLFGAKLALEEDHPERPDLDMLGEIIAGMFAGAIDASTGENE